MKVYRGGADMSDATDFAAHDGSARQESSNTQATVWGVRVEGCEESCWADGVCECHAGVILS